MAQLGSILEAQEAPKSRPKPKKIDVKIRCVVGIVFLRIRTPFWTVFDRFLGPKIEEKHKNTMLAKSSKIVNFPVENQHFQEIEVSNK